MPSPQSIAEQFYHAFYEKEWPGEPAPDFRKLTVADSYEVQGLVAELRIQSGERVVGYKVDCTSPAIQTQFGFGEPICARLFAPHVQSEGSQLNWRSYLNCAIEPEMVIRIGRDIPSGELSDQELIESIEFVSPGIELHNFKFWQQPPSIQELICSGGILAGLIVGQSRVDPRLLSFSDERFSVYKNDELIAEEPASEIMGGPLRSLKWLAGFLSARGDCLLKDSWVIPGSPTELIPVAKDTDLKVSIERVGDVYARFQDTPT